MGLDNPIHIAFILVLVLLVFGAKRLPDMGRSLGAGMRGFRDELSGTAGSASTVAEATVPSALPAAVAAPTADSPTGVAALHAVEPVIGA